MTKVFILGATGFIGFETAKAFASLGYTVYGLTRSEEKAKLLLQNEIRPVVGKAQDTTIWESIAADCSIILEILSDLNDSSTVPIVQSVLLKLLNQDKQKIVIYTSGVWTIGPTGNRTATESDPCNPPLLVKTRLEVEKAYCNAGAIVLRPGCVYGKHGGLTSFWFKGLKEGKVELFGTEGHYCPLVHVLDCANAFVLAVEKGEAFRGHVFNIVGSNEILRDCISALGKAIGFTGQVQFKQAQDPFSECLGLDQHVSSHKAKRLLGWIPKYACFQDDPEKYYNAWISLGN